MSALSAATTYTNIKKVWSLPYSFRIANAVRIYAGAFCGLPGTNALTSKRGYLCQWQNQVNLQWAGIAEAQSWTGGLITAAQSGTTTYVNSVLGDSAGTPVPEITVECGPQIICAATVTGVSAQSDVWRSLVYCSTDNYTDMQTTATSYSPAIGKVLYWHSSTTADVFIFGLLNGRSIL